MDTETMKRAECLYEDLTCQIRRLLPIARSSQAIPKNGIHVAFVKRGEGERVLLGKLDLFQLVWH